MQNTVALEDIGAVLARQVGSQITEGLTAAGIPTSGDSGGGSLDVAALPPVVQDIVRAAYGDATGHIFLISAAMAVLGVVAAVQLRPVTLRSSLDLPDAATAAAVAADAVDGAPTFDQVAVEPAPRQGPAQA